MLHQLGLDQDGDNLPGGEAEGDVVQDGQNAGNLARVARDAYPDLVVVGEEIVHDHFAARHLVLRRLALVLVAVPQLVVLRKALLEAEVGGVGVDPGLGGTAVAGMDADGLTEELLDDGPEGFVGGRGRLAKVTLAVCMHRLRGEP